MLVLFVKNKKNPTKDRSVKNTYYNKLNNTKQFLTVFFLFKFIHIKNYLPFNI